MKIKAHCSGILPSGLYEKLSESGVKIVRLYEQDYLPKTVVLDIFSDHPLFEETTITLDAIKEYVYTEQERSNAEWLTLRSTNNKLEAEELEKTFVGRCPFKVCRSQSHYHHEQVAPYSFRKPIKWGKNHFYSCYFSSYYTIFCDALAKQFIEESGLSGIDILPVMRYKSNIQLDDIFQIKATTFLPDEALVIDESFREVKCPICGEISYDDCSFSKLIVKKDFLPDVDFCSTNAIFGDIGQHSFNIVSGLLYHKFKEAGMTRNLLFEPLQTE